MIHIIHQQVLLLYLQNPFSLIWKKVVIKNNFNWQKFRLLLNYFSQSRSKGRNKEVISVQSKYKHKSLIRSLSTKFSVQNLNLVTTKLTFSVPFST